MWEALLALPPMGVPGLYVPLSSSISHQGARVYRRPSFRSRHRCKKFYSGMEATLTEQKICLRRMTNPAYAGDSEERLTNSYLVGGCFGRMKVIAGIQPLGFLAPGNECKALTLP